MAQISIINKRDVNQANRFDAEYFKTEYLELVNLLSNLFTLKLNDKEVCLISDGNHLKISDYFTKDIESVPYYRGQDVKDFFLENATPLRIEEAAYNKEWMKRSYFQKDDILLSIVGTIGNLSYVTEKIEKSTGSCKLAILRPNKINPGYLAGFLLSKYGQKQIKRNIRGALQQGLILQDTELIQIFIPNNEFQSKVDNVIQKAIVSNRNSKHLYIEAEKILLKELNLLDFKPKHKLTFETTKSKIDVAERFDAEYFQPKYKEIIEKIENYDGGWDFVGNIVNWEKGIEVGSDAYNEKGNGFIRVSDFSKMGFSESNKKISTDLYKELKEKYKPNIGDILFTKDGTIGISYVVKEDYQGIISGAFLNLTLKENFRDFQKECLALIFNSIVCKLQVEQLSGGALIAHLKPSDFEKFKIPLINQDIQKEIAEKILESHKLRKESKQQLENAKKMVEDEIERTAKT